MCLNDRTKMLRQRVLDPKYDILLKPKCKQPCQSAESTPSDRGTLAMMDRVRSSRSTSGGMEVARRGVARRLQPTINVGPDVRVRVLELISALPYLHRPTAVETRKRNASKSN